jgi:LPS sulfotransferase NodH
MMRPHTSYLICATNRSGSSLLCEALKNTGIAGRPEEYFWRDDEPFWSERWSVSTYADYLNKAIEEGTTPNGVFGAKVMWGYFDDFLTKLRRIPEYEELAVPDLMRTVFPNPHYIWMTRRDKVRQAVSFWKAIETGIWACTGDEPPTPAKEPVFDFEPIDYLVQEIVTHEAAWQQYFSECGVTPFTVVYEELVLAYEETARQTLQYLSIPIPENLVFAERQLKKQADALSEEWVQRYHDLKRAQAERRIRRSGDSSTP